jgi:hypothetical protein
VWQSFLSVFPHLLGGTMATSQTCCHLPGEMLNSAAECADRARIYMRCKAMHAMSNAASEIANLCNSWNIRWPTQNANVSIYHSRTLSQGTRKYVPQSFDKNCMSPIINLNSIPDKINTGKVVRQIINAIKKATQLCKWRCTSQAEYK